MKEIVIISGKGGTGKTSLTAALASLAEGAVFGDCDVDAADLFLVLAPTVRERHDFRSGREAVIRPEVCISCGACLARCRFAAVTRCSASAATATFSIDPLACEGCGVCVRACPVDAIDFPERHCGQWMVSDTRFGPMVHARLNPGGENSGKLVAIVRRESRRIAEAEGRSLVIIDGPPGIGCPVIAAVSGADGVVAVTEPSCSGRHDLARVMQLAGHFNIPVHLCINKWNINPEMSGQIEDEAVKSGATLLGRIDYDPCVTAAQLAGKTVIEMGRGAVTTQIETIWNHLIRSLQ